MLLRKYVEIYTRKEIYAQFSYTHEQKVTKERKSHEYMKYGIKMNAHMMQEFRSFVNYKLQFAETATNRLHGSCSLGSCDPRWDSPNATTTETTHTTAYWGRLNDLCRDFADSSAKNDESEPWASRTVMTRQLEEDVEINEWSAAPALPNRSDRYDKTEGWGDEDSRSITPLAWLENALRHDIDYKMSEGEKPSAFKKRMLENLHKDCKQTIVKAWASHCQSKGVNTSESTIDVLRDFTLLQTQREGTSDCPAKQSIYYRTIYS
jgi:hypothetical protein